MRALVYVYLRVLRVDHRRVSTQTERVGHGRSLKNKYKCMDVRMVHGVSQAKAQRSVSQENVPSSVPQRRIERKNKRKTSQKYNQDRMPVAIRQSSTVLPLL